ncbi:unnamed protein product [Malus baccata var. baccata]
MRSEINTTKRKSPIGSISMVESFDACPHEESEAHEEDDIDSGRRRTLLLQLMARSPLASYLEKDARSCIPDIETKKYCVDSIMRFGDFVDFIRKQIKHHFLMYQVYANNIDKYGFLCMTYSGECRICGLGNMSPRIVDNVAARSDIIPDMVKEGRKQNSTLIHS